MKISAKQASNIVDSLFGVIDHDINFIDLDSIIIASSNPERVGDFHEGSKLLYETGKPIIITDDNQYVGTKAGINYPVTFDNEIVATIGITGQYEEIKRFSSVIVKMTEILIKEVYFRDQRELQQENERYLVELIVNKLESKESILKKAHSLGIDMEGFQHLAVIKLQEKEYKFTNTRQLMFNSIKRRLDSKELIVNYQGDFILLLRETDIHKVKQIKEYITSKYDLEVVVGYSEHIVDFDAIYHQYQNTYRIALLAHRMSRFEIVDLNAFDLELILLDINPSIKKTYLHKVFGGVDEDNLSQWSEMILSFAWNNGSINATSKELYIHKNTLQYRLKKVHDVTGYDPRKLRDFTILYLAILLLKQ